MNTAEVLSALERDGYEREALLMAIERAMAITDESGNRVLTDWSPGTPQYALLQAVAMVASGAVYYAHNILNVIERYLVEEIFAASPLEGTQATCTVVAELQSPAPSGGYTIARGTILTSGSVTWELLTPIVIPAGNIGTEQAPGGAYRYTGVARARTVGPMGNIPPGTPLSPSPPISGVRRLFTPSGGTGGAPPETYEEMLDRVFRRQLDDGQTRLVTITDYAQYVERRLGRGARTHVWTPPPVPGYVTVSILYPNGTPVSHGDPILAELNERSPLAPVRLEPVTVVPIDVTVQVTYDPRLVGYAALMAEVQDRLTKLLHPSQWPYLGSPSNVVARSLIVATIQNITGVTSVNLSQPSGDVNLGSPAAVPILNRANVTLVAI